jgi:hypothetical protein
MTVPNHQSEISNQQSQIHNRKRPLTVTLLALWVLTITLLNWVRFGYTLSDWSFNASILPFSPFYVAGSGLIWGLLGLGVFGALWRGWRGARRLTTVVSSAYFIYYLVDRLWVARSAPLTPFSLIAGSLLFIISYWVVTRRKARAFFGEFYES